MPVDAISATVKVTKVLENIGISYFIGGLLASTLYGMVRTTQDSDIITHLCAEHVPWLVDALKSEFYIDDEMILDAVVDHSSFNIIIIHRESMFKVDIFVPQSSTFLEMQFSRARKEMLSSDQQVVANVASPEDVLLAKLDWYRMGGEVLERQWRDVLGVLKVQAGALDVDYMERMARLIQVEDLLDRALKEASYF